MKNENVFINAAKLITSGKEVYSCNAMSWGENFHAREFYAKEMSPNSKGPIDIDDVESVAREELDTDPSKPFDSFSKKVRKANRDFRVLLILFAGELAEDF